VNLQYVLLGEKRITELEITHGIILFRC